jgi:DNA-binding MarR family transcriptional regulator
MTKGKDGPPGATKRTLSPAPKRSKTVDPLTPVSAWPAGNGDAIPAIGEIGLNQFAPYLLNRLSAQWNGEMQEVLRGLHISTTKMRALAVLTVASGITVNELAVFAVTEQSTMSRTLDALEDQDLICRRAKAEDMRVREVFITEKGLNLFSTLWPEIYALYARFFEGVDEVEFRGFIATLHKVLRNTRGQPVQSNTMQFTDDGPA